MRVCNVPRPRCDFLLRATAECNEQFLFLSLTRTHTLVSCVAMTLDATHVIAVHNAEYVTHTWSMSKTREHRSPNSTRGAERNDKYTRILAIVHVHLTRWNFFLSLFALITFDGCRCLRRIQCEMCECVNVVSKCLRSDNLNKHPYYTVVTRPRLIT